MGKERQFIQIPRHLIIASVAQRPNDAQQNSTKYYFQRVFQSFRFPNILRKNIFLHKNEPEAQNETKASSLLGIS